MFLLFIFYFYFHFHFLFFYFLTLRDEERSWVCVDLGANVRLYPSRFCLLHGDVNKKNAIRNFEIQGKTKELGPWILLKRFRNNVKLSDACHSTAAWKITRKKFFSDIFLHPSRCDWGDVTHLGFR